MNYSLIAQSKRVPSTIKIIVLTKSHNRFFYQAFIKLSKNTFKKKILLLIIFFPENNSINQTKRDNTLVY